jgi:hypothetical protein
MDVLVVLFPSNSQVITSSMSSRGGNHRHLAGLSLKSILDQGATRIEAYTDVCSLFIIGFDACFSLAFSSISEATYKGESVQQAVGGGR